MLIGAQSQALEVTIIDNQGKPFAGAVVEIQLNKIIDNTNLPTVSSMAQKNKRFVPHILPVVKGASVTFPNKDSIKHHVYSFSPAKQFELKLYKDALPDPIVLDKAGIIAMGCNIHDWMAGFIYVADSPYVGLTDEKGVYRVNLPAKVAGIKIWHPRFSDNDISRASQTKVNQQKMTFKLNDSLYPSLDVEAEEFSEYE